MGRGPYKKKDRAEVKIQPASSRLIKEPLIPVPTDKERQQRKSEGYTPGAYNPKKYQLDETAPPPAYARMGNMVHLHYPFDEIPTGETPIRIPVIDPETGKKDPNADPKRIEAALRSYKKQPKNENKKFLIRPQIDPNDANNILGYWIYRQS